MSALYATVDLIPHTTAARTARRAAADVLTGWGLPDLMIDDVTLVVSELVTNAVVHAAQEGPMALSLSVTDHVVRVSLTDESPQRPRQRQAGDSDEGGRGVAIVDALADRWGVEPLGPGKCIWFEIDRPSAA